MCGAAVCGSLYRQSSLLTPTDKASRRPRRRGRFAQCRSVVLGHLPGGEPDKPLAMLVLSAERPDVRAWPMAFTADRTSLSPKSSAGNRSPSRAGARVRERREMLDQRRAGHRETACPCHKDICK